MGAALSPRIKVRTRIVRLPLLDHVAPQLHPKANEGWKEPYRTVAPAGLGQQHNGYKRNVLRPPSSRFSFHEYIDKLVKPGIGQPRKYARVQSVPREAGAGKERSEHPSKPIDRWPRRHRA